MEYWTILWITMLSTGGSFGVPYQSLADCNAARAVVSDTLRYDHTIKCVETEEVSKIMRPLPRPEK